MCIYIQYQVTRVGLQGVGDKRESSTQRVDKEQKTDK